MACTKLSLNKSEWKDSQMVCEMDDVLTLGLFFKFSCWWLELVARIYLLYFGYFLITRWPLQRIIAAFHLYHRLKMGIVAIFSEDTSLIGYPNYTE